MNNNNLDNKKTYFALSDIHGRLVSIEDFEEKGFNLDNDNHIIVLIGDYFDRHPNNLEVLEFLEKYKNLLNKRFILLKGNHDEFVNNFITYIDTNIAIGEEIVNEPYNLERWLRNGGDITLTQLFGEYEGLYTNEKAKNLLRLKNFWKMLDDYYETKDYIFTHAGINERRQVDTWDREFLHKGMLTDKTVIIGHTSHKYMEDDVVFEDYGTGVIAKSKSITLCDVLDIDSGYADNIVVFKEKWDM